MYNLLDEIEDKFIESLKENIKECEKDLLLQRDIHETPDNSFAILASLYQVLRYYSAPSDYNKFVQKRRKKIKGT